MLVARFLDGLAGSAFLSVAGGKDEARSLVSITPLMLGFAGTVGDMFTREKLSAPMMIYTASPFMGPELGPVVGGFINQYTDWRWSFVSLDGTS
jgi:MFS family permease